MRLITIRFMKVLLLSLLAVNHALGAGGVVKSPTGTAPDRYVYYPGQGRAGGERNPGYSLWNRYAGSSPWPGCLLLPG
jgi:hypothetical protein